MAGDLGAAPCKTADAVTEASEELAVAAFVLKDADTEDGNGRTLLTSLVYISMLWLPALLQKS